MPNSLTYKVFFRDRQDNIQRVKRMRCASDEEAKSRLATLLDGANSLEVWQQTRLIGRFGPDGTEDAA